MKFLIIVNKIINLNSIKYIEFNEEDEEFTYVFEDKKHSLYGVNEFVFKEFIKFMYSETSCFNMDTRILYSTEREREFYEDKGI